MARLSRRLIATVAALVVAVAPIVGAVGPGTTSPAQEERATGNRTFAIEQPTVPPLATDVEPLSNGETIEEFYDTWGGVSDTGLEQADTSIIFLWDGPDGTSLVVVHDKAGTLGGGAATLNFTGLPAFGIPSTGPAPAIPGEGSWVVKEGPPDFQPPSQPPNVISWSWQDYYNDGGAYRGGMNGSFVVHVEPAFNEDALEDPMDPGTVEDWVFLTGDVDDPTEIPLDMETPLLIEGTE